MKTFVTSIPLQSSAGLQSTIYEPMGNSLLKYGQTSFPIIPVVNAYTETGDGAKVIAIAFDNDDCARNLIALKSELKGLADLKGLNISVEVIAVPIDNSVESMLSNYSQIIERLHDEDELHACITFGSKPLAIIEIMALQYAYRTKWNVSVECVVYGEVNRENGKVLGAKIYDITAFVQLDEIVRLSADGAIREPEKLITSLLEG